MKTMLVPCQHFSDALAVFQCSLTADFRIRTCAQAFGHAGTQLQNGTCANVFQRLSIGVGADELDAFDVALDHVIDCVAAATANTDNFNYRALRDVVYEFEHFPSPSVL